MRSVLKQTLNGTETIFNPKLLVFQYNLKYQLLIALHSFSLTCKTFPTEKQLFFFNFKYFILNLMEFSFWELHKKHFLDCKIMCCVFHIFPFLFSVSFFSPLYNKIFKSLLQDCLLLLCTYSFYLIFFCAWFLTFWKVFHIVLLCEVGECFEYDFRWREKNFSRHLSDVFQKPREKSEVM